MRNILIIIISLVITTLNINSFGELDSDKLKFAKLMAGTENEIVLEKSINWSFGTTFFNLFYFAEMMFISEIGRRKIS